MMLKLMILMMLVTSSTNADNDTDKYGNCIRQYPCDLDGKSLHHLPKDERNKILACRLARHMKCVVPDEETGFVLDPVYEYFKVYGAYLD